MAEIVLSSAVRNNLLSLQSTASLLAKTQERLATGLKVNSALDDPTAFFTASSLNSRAGDLNRLLDSVGNAVQTVAAADQGLSALTKLVETAQANVRQALQSPGPVTPAVASTSTGGTTIADNAAVLALTGTLTITGTAGAYSIDFDGTGGTSGNAVETLAELTAELANASTATGTTVAFAGAGTPLSITANASETFTLSGDHAGLGGAIANGTIAATNAAVAGFNNTLSITVGAGTQQDIDLTAATNQTDLLSIINAGLTGATATIVSDAVVITAANTTESLTLAGAGATSLGLSSSAPTVGATVNNADRTALETSFNNLRTQIDQLAADASFNGNNLLDGDNLTVIFNEAGTSTLSITGVTFNSAGLGITVAAAASFQTDTVLNAKLTELSGAIDSLRQQASTFGSNLSVVEIRQDFTKNLINTLETGAANLTLADTNEEGANTLALQTRQQLSSVALSLASQADQQVLRLFG
ncbi:MAG: flagellin N-terminal helical domain-containing protein [Alphaproteobacteria bacterium]